MMVLPRRSGKGTYDFWHTIPVCQPRKGLLAVCRKVCRSRKAAPEAAFPIPDHLYGIAARCAGVPTGDNPCTVRVYRLSGM